MSAEPRVAPATSHATPPASEVAPTIRAAGGSCSVVHEAVLAENDQPSRGIAVAFAHGRGVAVWPVAADRVALVRLGPSGDPVGTSREQPIDNARGVHLLAALGEHFVLMTRGICVAAPRASAKYCTTYLALDERLDARGEPLVVEHTNQAKAVARVEHGDALFLELAMETGLDSAGLSAPTFDAIVQRLAFDANGNLAITRTPIAEPAEDAGEQTRGTLGLCADGVNVCGVLCASESNRCAPIGIGTRFFRNPIVGSEPRSVRCNADGCDVFFRRGPTARGRHLTTDGGSTVIEVAPAASDATLTGVVEEGRFTRRDPTGAIVGEPVEITARDARSSVAWTGTQFLVASLTRRDGTTRHVLTTVGCAAAP